jgi:pimeloyl-ACP methyl ester carboxylesterase
MNPTTFMRESAGIHWYCEQRGKGPTVVLVPSGEGDCAAFETVAAALADRFTVLTFDTPGFSRTSAPPDPAQITVNHLAGQIAALVGSLGIDKATFYGCSSGAIAVLDLLLDHSALVRNSVIHEAAIVDPDRLSAMTLMGDLTSLDDAGVVAACTQMFATLFNEDLGKWQGLGADYHRRLDRNYVTWVRHYWKNSVLRQYDPALLAGRPLAWTIGGLTPAVAFFNNVQIATKAGIETDILMCKHFPQVSIAQQLADYIRAKTLPHIES